MRCRVAMCIALHCGAVESTGIGLQWDRDGHFCLIFARAAQQSLLDGTNGLSSFKPCVYCRIVLSRASRGNLCDSTDFLLILTSGRSGTQAWAPDRPDVKIKNHGLGKYGAEPHYSTILVWQLCALKGYSFVEVTLTSNVWSRMKFVLRYFQ